MEETSIDLPDECWALIFNHGSDFESLSLVSKRFLSITNHIRVSLSVSNPANHVICNLLQRSPNLRKIRLVNFPGDLNQAILAISKSGLNLEELDLSRSRSFPTVGLEELGSNMKNVKVLDCSYSTMTNSDILRIANSFPQLEELQITFSSFDDENNGKFISVTDEEIEFLSSKLKRLRKIHFLGHPRISDKSLIYLSSNCKFLEQIEVFYSDGVTEKGILFLIQNTHHLNSLSLCGNFMIGSCSVKGCTNFPKNLQSLSFSSVEISDEFLFSITKACIPLRNFTLSSCKGYTIAGLSSVLNSSQSLQSLALVEVDFLTDEDIEKFTRFLHNLTSIRLHSCPKLSESSFVMLTQRCHLLSDISMSETSLGKEEHNYDDLKNNLAITSLQFSSNQYLRSSILRRILKICPNVEYLSLYKCFQRDKRLDVADILEGSRGIQSLVLNGCWKVEFSRREIEISKLQNLMASRSGITDEVLTMIGRKCPGLLHLDLNYFKIVTEKGVKELVKSCEKLRYLSLRKCSNLTFDEIEWIVSTRPSLRHLIVLQYPEEDNQKYTWIAHTTPFFGKQEYLLLDGCLVFRALRPRITCFLLYVLNYCSYLAAVTHAISLSF